MTTLQENILQKLCQQSAKISDTLYDVNLNTGKVAYEDRLERTVQGLKEQVRTQEELLQELRESSPIPAFESPSRDSEARLRQIYIAIRAYKLLTAKEPQFPPRDSPLPALLALRNTGQLIEGTKEVTKATRVKLSRAKDLLGHVESELRDDLLITTALEERSAKLRDAFDENSRMSPEKAVENLIRKEQIRRMELDKESKKLVKEFNGFIDQHLAGMLAAKELGGPVVGELLDIDDEALGAGFDTKRKVRTQKATKSEQDGRKRQQRIDDIWGTQTDLGVLVGAPSEKKAAGSEMRSLVEELLNATAEHGDSRVYVRLQRDSAAARFLTQVRAGKTNKMGSIPKECISSMLDEHEIGEFLSNDKISPFDILGSARRDLRKTTLPESLFVEQAKSSLVAILPNIGFGLQRTTKSLLNDIAPGLNGSSLSPNYYGFVTGGVTPAARLAEIISSIYDQNVAVHLPDQSVATIVEDKALRLLQDLLCFSPEAWKGRIFTTGATSSNILGLACGRQWVLSSRYHTNSANRDVFSDYGLLEQARLVNVDQIQILTTMPHSSLYKAASVVGIGRKSVCHVGREGNGLQFDIGRLEEHLTRPRTASIVVISCGEINTGFYATRGVDEMHQIRQLCNDHQAWLHVDGAFGIFARALPSLPEFDQVRRGAEGLEMADSITGDAHKLLNVPYDCGFFFCSDPDIAQQVFKNPNAVYLSTSSSHDNIPSPLNIGIENSRRFRGLPVYATLTCYGRDSYQDMILRQVRFARAVAKYILDHADLELLPEELGTQAQIDRKVFIVVLFRAKDPDLNLSLVQMINASLKMYVSGTIWDGKPASRIAVSNWQVKGDRDLMLVQSVLEEVFRQWRNETTISKITA